MGSFLFYARIFLLLSNYLLSFQTYQPYARTNAIHMWRNAPIEFPSARAEYEAIQLGEFVPEAVTLCDTDYHARTGRYFTTSPLYRNGTPGTLWEVNGEQGLWRPFPSWQRNYEKCQGPFSVFRISIDKCGLMWVVDTGRDDILGTFTSPCRPKLLIYDLNDRDREILRYEFPENVASDRSLPITIVTESYEDNCADSIAYIADSQDPGALIVFDLAKQSSWKIHNPLFWPYPSDPSTVVNGVTVETGDYGVIGLALGPSTYKRDERKLYFHSLASLRESWAPVGVLKNQTLGQDPIVARTAFALSPGERQGQSTVEVMTDDGILLYALLTENAVACWNTRTPFTPENQHILLKDDEHLQFITGLKLQGNKLIISSTKLQNYLEGVVDRMDIKYRVLVNEDVKGLLYGSPCFSSFGRNYASNDFAPSWNRLHRFNL